MTDQEKTIPFDVENAIVQVFRMPQCLTEPLSIDFIHQAVDLFATDEGWNDLDVIQQGKVIEKAVTKMEADNKLTSKVVKVKIRHFDDDIDPPQLRKNVRVYSIVR